MSTRRDFLLRTGHGFGGAALAAMLQGATTNPLAPKLPHQAAKAKSVIYLFMHGGASHVDTFDPKPELTRMSGKPISAEAAKGLKTSFIHDPTKALLRGSPWKFERRGKSGIEVSELYTHVGAHIDDIAVIRSCHSDQFDHAPAIFLRNSGSQFPGRPCLGFLGDLRPGDGESGSAGVCGDDGRLHQERASLRTERGFCPRFIRGRCSAARRIRC